MTDCEHLQHLCLQGISGLSISSGDSAVGFTTAVQSVIKSAPPSIHPSV